MDNTDKKTPYNRLDTPVLLLVFNRIDTTRKVFNAIRAAKPTRLYVAADGARSDKKGELEKVAAVTSLILSNIDWDCEVKTLFRDSNLGCKSAVDSAISWFFEQEEMGIVLEDDCLPSPYFFTYCSQLLEKYKYDQRIFLISGYNKQNTWKSSENDYFFSQFGGIWGWASWRRAWLNYDSEMLGLESFIEKDGFKKLLGKKLGRIRKSQFLKCRRKNIDSWAYPWALTRHLNGALACVPSRSLIENIGFGPDATHTLYSSSDRVTRHTYNHELRENSYVIPDSEYDAKFISTGPLIIKILNRISSKLLGKT